MITTMPLSPRVSIVMSVYNGANYLGECIKSILAQTFENFEFIIIDDCSTDKTLEILKSFIDSRIKIIENEENKGLTKSLNIGISYATGDYIARMDADDISMRDRLSRQVVFLDSNPSLIAVGSGIILIDENSGKIGGRLKPLLDNELKYLTLFYSPFYHPTVMFRRSPNGNPLFYDENLATAQDYGLWGKMASLGEFANLPNCLVCFRLNPESITQQRRKQQIVTHKKISNQLVLEKLGLEEPIDYLDEIYRILLTEEDLSSADVKKATSTLMRLASLMGGSFIGVVRLKAVAAEFLFNHTLRKRGIRRGILPFSGTIIQTKGFILFFLAWRLQSMITRYLIYRNVKDL